MPCKICGDEQGAKHEEKYKHAYVEEDIKLQGSPARSQMDQILEVSDKVERRSIAYGYCVDGVVILSHNELGNFRIEKSYSLNCDDLRKLVACISVALFDPDFQPKEAI